MTTVGSGKHTYTLTSDWAQMPDAHPLGAVSALASDSAGDIYAFHRADPPIAIFDRNDGSFKSGWGNGGFVYAHGFYIEDDIVYLTDRDTSTCIMYTLDGKPIQMLGRNGVHSDTGCEVAGALVPRAAGPFNYPAELVPSPSGDLYVADGYRNARIHRFDNDGRLKYSWGKPGKEHPYEFHLPHSLLVTRDDRVYVCDRENSRIQVFNTSGDFLTMWADTCRPTDIAETPEGDFVVSQLAPLDESHPPRVAIFDRDGNVLARWDSRSAHGIWCDAHGDIFLALTGDRAVDKYGRG